MAIEWIALIGILIAMVQTIWLAWFLVVKKGKRRASSIAADCVALVIIALIITAFAIIGNMAAQAEEIAPPVDGARVAKELTESANGNQNLQGVLQRNITSESIPGYAGTSLPENNLSHDGLVNAEDATLGDSRSKARATITSQPHWAIENSEFESALTIQENPESGASLEALLSGNYEDCEVAVNGGGQPEEQHFCDRWPVTNEQTCTWDRQVTYSQNRSYECRKHNTRTRKKCKRVLEKFCSRLNVSHDPKKIFNMKEHGVAYEFSDTLPNNLALPGGFSIGHEDNQGVNCGYYGCAKVFYSGIEFVIKSRKDLDKITEFKLTYAHYDDYMGVELNHRLVWGRDDFRTRSGYYLYDRGLTVTHDIDLDLKPYLIVGRNRLLLRGLVRHIGSVYAEFHITQRACDNYTETWSESCE